MTSPAITRQGRTVTVLLSDGCEGCLLAVERVMADRPRERWNGEMYTFSTGVASGGGATAVARLSYRDEFGTVEVLACDHAQNRASQAGVQTQMFTTICGMAEGSDYGWLLPDLVKAVRACARSGATTAEDALFAVSGWNGAEGQMARAAGMTAGDAWQWGIALKPDLCDPPLARAEVVQWFLSGAEPRKAWRWVLDTHVRGPGDRPPGLDIGEVILLTYAGLPLIPAWSIGDKGLCLFFAEDAAAAGHAPQDIVAIGQAVRARLGLPRGGERCEHGILKRDTPVRCGWRTGDWSRVREVTDEWAGLDWSALRVCLDAGLSFAEAEEHVRAGRDMGPLRLLVGLTG